MNDDEPGGEQRLPVSEHEELTRILANPDPTKRRAMMHDFLDARAAQTRRLVRRMCYWYGVTDEEDYNELIQVAGETLWKQLLSFEADPSKLDALKVRWEVAMFAPTRSKLAQAITAEIDRMRHGTGGVTVGRRRRAVAATRERLAARYGREPGMYEVIGEVNEHYRSTQTRSHTPLHVTEQDATPRTTISLDAQVGEDGDAQAAWAQTVIAHGTGQFLLHPEENEEFLRAVIAECEKDEDERLGLVARAWGALEVGVDGLVDLHERPGADMGRQGNPRQDIHREQSTEIYLHRHWPGGAMTQQEALDLITRVRQVAYDLYLASDPDAVAGRERPRPQTLKEVRAREAEMAKERSSLPARVSREYSERLDRRVAKARERAQETNERTFEVTTRVDPSIVRPSPQARRRGSRPDS